MKIRLLLITMMGGMVSAAGSYAAVDYPKEAGNCPAAYYTEYGDLANEDAICIKKRNNIKVALNMSSAALNPKSGINQVINNAISMTNNYKNVYGIEIGDGLEMSIVAHFQGAKFLLDDAKYDAVTCPDATWCPNPSKSAVEGLLAKGVHIYMCETTMKANGWTSDDLITGVEEVPGGVLALVDFALGGWAVLTP